MTLADLQAAIRRAGGRLSRTSEGRLRYEAPGPVSKALVEGMETHRTALLAQLAYAEGRMSDGRLDVAWLATQPGRCSTCALWRGPDGYGEGQCLLGRRAHGWLDGVPLAPVTTTIHYSCGAREGRGWRRKPSAQGGSKCRPAVSAEKPHNDPAQEFSDDEEESEKDE